MRSWLLEISLAVLATLLGLWFFHESRSEPGPRVLPEAIAGTLAFLGVLLFRRTHPVALTAVLIPAGILLALPMGATPIALFAVALHRRPRWVISLAAGHAVLVVVIYAIALGLTRLYYESVAFLVLLHVSLVAVGMLIRGHRQSIASWAERARQAEEAALAQRLRVEQARLAERERIAREMHDVLAHRLSLLAVHAGALEVRRDAPRTEQEAAGVIRQCAYDALEDLRTVIGMLRTPGETAAESDEADRPPPTLGDVPALVEQSREAGARIGLSLAGGDGLPERVGRHAYRIVQEALTNARKHAPGAPVRVDISACPERGLTVEVDNALAPGSGIPGAGAGLAGLRERVQLVGGRLEHGPTPAGEFHLRAWLPWHA